jgi:hypothetical protein
MVTVTSGSNINSNDYNDLVGRVNTIMGIGSGTTGYGQAITASNVAGSSTTDIAASQWDNLRVEIDKANRHQTGSNTGIGDIQAGNAIGANASTSSTTYLEGDTLDAANKGINDYNTAVTAIEASPLSFDASYVVTESGAQGSNAAGANYNAGLRFTSNWQFVQGQLDVSFAGGYTCKNNDGSDVTATAADHARHFFNAGGAVIFNPSLATDSPDSLKEQDWRDLLNQIGDVFFGATASSSTGTRGSATTVGYHDLTGSNQLIFSATGGTVSGNYAENICRLYARIPTAGPVRFLIEYDDLDAGDQTGTGGPQDEDITADVYMDVSHRRASGSGEVTVAAPSYSMAANFNNIRGLTGFT